MKKWIVMIWLMLLLSAVSILFGHNEWKYQLPTPVPQNYKAVNQGRFPQQTLIQQDDIRAPR
jgi:hypothetical protein